MKLIIDMPEVVKHKVYAYGLSLSPSDKEQLINAIVNGTPIPDNATVCDIEQIRAEIEQTAKVYHEAVDYGRECGLQIALDIIDKYTKGENK